VSDYWTWTSAATLVLGFGSGVLAGMFGIGGAVLTTPAIRVLGATPIEGVGSTVPAILPGSISGAYRYAKEGLVSWRVGLVCGLTGAVFAALGAVTSDHIDGHILMVLTAALMAFSGISVIRSSRSAAVLAAAPAAGAEGDVAETIVPVDDGQIAEAAAGTGGGGPDAMPADARLGVPLLMVVGAGAGALAGLLGVGGGIVMVPAFTGLLRLPMKLAVGSSLVAVAIFSVPALITHTVLGHIAWRFAIPLVIGVIPGAQLGARLSFAASDTMIRQLFGWSVLAMSVVYGVSELLGLR
jgi:uncharacterized membrane protein YfcA